MTSLLGISAFYHDSALAWAALKDGRGQMRDQLQRFLGHTDLACIQWINMDNHDIDFHTLKKCNRSRVLK